MLLYWEISLAYLLDTWCNYKKNQGLYLLQPTDGQVVSIFRLLGIGNTKNILFSNLIGMVPYSFTTTSQIVLTLSLSVAIIFGVTIIGFNIHKLTFLSLFIPIGTPLGLVPLLVLIELISYLARAVSLGVRLAANVIAGHILLKILSTFIFTFIKQSLLFFIIGLLPVFIFTALVGLELAIAVLQAIVFIILTCSYIRDAVYLH